MGFLNTVPCN